MSTQEAVDLVREIFESGETSTVKVAEELLDISLDKGKHILSGHSITDAFMYSQVRRITLVRW